jgi:hypothetical protein
MLLLNPKLGDRKSTRNIIRNLGIWGIIMRTRLINLHQSDEGDYVYIGRPSKWGNPFISGRDGTREEVCRKYEQYFNEQLRASPLFKKALLELKGKTLACYCKPKQCHGDTIIKFLNLLEEDAEESSKGVVI